MKISALRKENNVIYSRQSSIFHEFPRICTNRICLIIKALFVLISLISGLTLSVPSQTSCNLSFRSSLKKQYFLFSVLFLSILTACVEVKYPYSKLPPGVWRAVLVLEDDPDSNKNDLELPFNFNLTYDSDEQLKMTIINGSERIEVDAIAFGRNKREGKDTIRIDFPLFDTHISGEYKENVIEGFWYVHYRDNYKIPFVARFGKNDRFDLCPKKSEIDITGKWDVRIEIETETEYPAIGEFEQEGNAVNGTFMTETGDYRYLEGIVCEDQLFLSCFDGSHAFYFDGKILESGNILGRFLSGTHYKSNWTGIQSKEVSLTDPYEFSEAVDPSQTVNFAFPNSEGKMVSLTDKKYEGKPKIIKIMGTWCPNCLDETNFLIDYIDSNPEKQIDIIAIAFEKYRDPQKAMEIIKRYKDKKGLPYEILYGGYYNKKEATEAFRFLKKIKSYPTLIFLDKDNRIQKIHTGFAGPATSEYEEFKVEFDNVVTKLLDGDAG